MRSTWFTSPRVQVQRNIVIHREKMASGLRLWHTQTEALAHTHTHTYTHIYTHKECGQSVSAPSEPHWPLVSHRIHEVQSDKLSLRLQQTFTYPQCLILCSDSQFAKLFLSHTLSNTCNDRLPQSDTFFIEFLQQITKYIHVLLIAQKILKQP